MSSNYAFITLSVPKSASAERLAGALKDFAAAEGLEVKHVMASPVNFYFQERGATTPQSRAESRKQSFVRTMPWLLGLLLAPMAHRADAGGQAAEPEPIVALLRTSDGCPTGQLRAIVSFNPSETYKFCWRLQGDLVEMLDRNNVVTAMPARWFAKQERAQ